MITTTLRWECRRYNALFKSVHECHWRCTYWNRGAYYENGTQWGTLIREGALVRGRALNRIIAVNVISVMSSVFSLPVSVTYPISLITWGWGFSFFINSSSESKFLLSDSGAFATKQNKTKQNKTKQNKTKQNKTKTNTKTNTQNKQTTGSTSNFVLVLDQESQ